MPAHDVQAGVAAPHVDRPERAQRILDALASDSRFAIDEATEHDVASIEAVHEPRMVAFLRDAWMAWQASYTGTEMVPDSILHPAMRAGMDEPPVEPRDPLGRAGYWCFDTGTPVGAGTYEAARAAADVALTAADLVLGGAPGAYALCRPPGHHAARSMYGGFCYFNNAAIAAQHVARQTRDRVAVIDLDYHHGNGTQQIFYQRADVLYVSLHADPARAYPYFSGYAEETGSGIGRGTNLNIPLPLGTSDEHYLGALDIALDAVVAFRPAISVVSLGFDTYHRDPLSDFGLTTAVYEEAGRRTAAAVGRLIVVQEGGYYLPDLGENAHQWLAAAAHAQSASQSA